MRSARPVYFFLPTDISAGISVLLATHASLSLSRFTVGLNLGLAKRRSGSPFTGLSIASLQTGLTPTRVNWAPVPCPAYGRSPMRISPRPPRRLSGFCFPAHPFFFAFALEWSDSTWSPSHQHHLHTRGRKAAINVNGGREFSSVFGAAQHVRRVWR